MSDVVMVALAFILGCGAGWSMHRDEARQQACMSECAPIPGTQRDGKCFCLSERAAKASKEEGR